MELALLTLAIAIVYHSLKGRKTMAEGFANLTAEVAEMKDVATSAVAVLNSINERIAEAIEADDLEEDSAMQLLANELSDTTDALAAAVAANTPSDPVEEPPVEEPPVAPTE